MGKPESKAMQELRRMLEEKEAQLDGSPTPDEIDERAKAERRKWCNALGVLQKSPNTRKKATKNTS